MQLLLFSDELIIEESETWQERLHVCLKSILTAPMAAEYTHKWKTTISPAGLAIPTITAAGHRTSGNGSGGDSGEMTGYPTPVAQPANGTPEDFLRRKRESVARGNSMGITLSDLNMVAQTFTGYPTPTLNGVVSGYSTPTVTDANRGSLPPRPTDTGIPLTQQVAGYGTPRVTTDQLPRQIHGLITPSERSETASPGVLNAAFSRWLMGYPATWDEASPNYLEWRRAQELIASAD